MSASPQKFGVEEERPRRQRKGGAPERERQRETEVAGIREARVEQLGPQAGGDDPRLQRLAVSRVVTPVREQRGEDTPDPRRRARGPEGRAELRFGHPDDLGPIERGPQRLRPWAQEQNVGVATDERPAFTGRLGRGQSHLELEASLLHPALGAEDAAGAALLDLVHDQLCVPRCGRREARSQVLVEQRPMRRAHANVQVQGVHGVRRYRG